MERWWPHKKSMRWYAAVLAVAVTVGLLVMLQFSWLRGSDGSDPARCRPDWDVGPAPHYLLEDSAWSSSRRVEWCGREWASFNYSQHDVVLPIDQPNCITRTVIENVLRFWNFRRLVFMINDVAHCPELLALADGIGVRERIQCVSRDDIIPGITVESLGRLPPTVRGWIFQQLVKLGAALRFADLSPLFLVWDSDLLPLKPIPLFGYVSSLDQPRATFFAGHLSSHNAKAKETYHHMYEALTGLKLIDPPGGSWVYGWQVWYRPYVQEFLRHIATRAKRDPSEWAQVIIDTIVKEFRSKPSMNMRNSFSEFDSYGSWVWTQHPQHVDFWHKSDELWVRYPEALQSKGECCPTYETLCDLAQKYVYVPWENHKFKSCSPEVIHNTQHALRSIAAVPPSSPHSSVDGASPPPPSGLTAVPSHSQLRKRIP